MGRLDRTTYRNLSGKASWTEVWKLTPPLKGRYVIFSHRECPGLAKRIVCVYILSSHFCRELLFERIENMSDILEVRDEEIPVAHCLLLILSQH